MNIFIFIYDTFLEMSITILFSINDLEDIRLVMIAIKDLRENEIRIDMSIAPIEESYAMLQAHGLNVAREESDRAELIKLDWVKLQNHCVSLKIYFTILNHFLI